MVSEKTVGDYVTLQRGITYKGILVGKPGPALLGLGSITPGGGFRTTDYKTYGGECPQNITLHPGDVFASLKGATKDGKMIGSVARVPDTVSKGRLTQDTVKLEFRDSNKEFESYLYWVLRTPQYRDYCAQRATGSAVVALSRDDFLNYPVPELDSCRKNIVSLLERLEEKTVLNTQANQTLENMAQALFKSWFVDFDPVIDNALAAGNAIPEPLQVRAEQRKALQCSSDTLDGQVVPQLPEAIRQLFPNSFVLDAEMGWVPEGWEVKRVGDVITNVGGGTPKTSELSFWEEGIHPFCTPKDMSLLTSKVLLETERHLTDTGIAKISSGKLPVGTVLMSSRAPIGYLAIADTTVSVNQGIIAMKPSGGFGSEYILSWAEANMDEVISRANGSTFLEISKKNFREIPFVVPSKDVLKQYDLLAKPYFARITSLQKEVNKLTQLRNTFLPKLISGELRIPEAETLDGLFEKAPPLVTQ